MYALNYFKKMSGEFIFHEFKGMILFSNNERQVTIERFL